MSNETSPAIPTAGELRERIATFISLADVVVSYDSVGRQYIYIQNQTELADAILALVSPPPVEGELIEALKDVLSIIHSVCPEYDEATVCANASAVIARVEGGAP